MSVLFLNHRIAVWCEGIEITVRRFALSCTLFLFSRKHAFDSVLCSGVMCSYPSRGTDADEFLCL